VSSQSLVKFRITHPEEMYIGGDGAGGVGGRDADHYSGVLGAPVAAVTSPSPRAHAISVSHSKTESESS
jgi:hypothetical protein